MPKGTPPVTTNPLLSALEALLPVVPPTEADRILRSAVAALGAAVGGQVLATPTPAAPLALAPPAPAVGTPVTKSKAKGRPAKGTEFTPGRLLSDEARAFLAVTGPSVLRAALGCSLAAIYKWRATNVASAEFFDRIEAMAAAAAPAAVAEAPAPSDLDTGLVELIWHRAKADGLTAEADLADRAGVSTEEVRAALSGQPVDQLTADRLEAWAVA